MDNSGLQNAPQQIVTTFRQFATLVQDELVLARAEISRNLSRAGMGIAFIGIAALMALVALNVFATALIGLLTAAGVPLWIAALSIGGGLLVVALIFAMAGKSRLEPEAIAPSRTIDNIKKDVEELKEAGHD